MTGAYSIIRTSWNDIEIEISWNPNYMIFDDLTHISHLEVESVSPARAPLPMTETGYKSRFMHIAAVESYGGAEPFVKAWLEDAARSSKWLEAQDAKRQLSLF